VKQTNFTPEWGAYAITVLIRANTKAPITQLSDTGSHFGLSDPCLADKY